MTETRYRRMAKLLDGASADNSPPTKGSDGINLHELRRADGTLPEWVTVAIRGTGTGTVTATFRLWFRYLNFWVPAGNGTDADKGKLNDATAVGEVATDTVLHAQPVRVPEHADRAYLEMLSSGGSALSFNAYIIASK